jgi:hypothetical protein
MIIRLIKCGFTYNVVNVTMIYILRRLKVHESNIFIHKPED